MGDARRVTGWFGRLGMEPEPHISTFMGSSAPGLMVENTDQAPAPRRAQIFVRLWLGFMTARVMLACMLVTLPWLLMPARVTWVPLASWSGLAYLLLSVVQRWQVGTQRSVQFSRHWVGVCVVLDFVAVALMNEQQPRVVNYYPLLALPLLYVSILGSRMQALGTAAALTLLLLGDVWRQGPEVDLSAQFLQAAAKGLGAMVAAWVVNYLSTRLDVEVRNAQINRLAAQTQVRVNELVMAEMSQGVIVADDGARLRIANPAALRLLGLPADTALPFLITERKELLALSEFVSEVFVCQTPVEREIEVDLGVAGSRGLRLKGRLTVTPGGDGLERYLCVVFMEDIQEVLARVRQEKMAAMGRVSAAVAHEIRNPLSAIVQASALLQEDGLEDRARRMNQIVQQNARRIARTVDEILDVSITHRPEMRNVRVDLAVEIPRICQDWKDMQASQGDIHVICEETLIPVRFDAEHLRRMLVNLLDNAIRHSVAPEPRVVLWLGVLPAAGHPVPVLKIWNRGHMVDASIAEHLFEPFFSSRSRSSGLGLYICRQLAELHGATISFSRCAMPGREDVAPVVDGNEFMVQFQWPDSGDPVTQKIQPGTRI